MDTDFRVVGIDPGTTAAVAVLALDGGLVDYTSRRGFSKDRIIQFIVDNGRPLIIAADVAPAPSLVDEIASNTGSVLYAPGDDLGQGHKDELVRPFAVSGEDSHVRDALAAAEYARREYSSLLDEIRRRVRDARVGEHLDEVVAAVVRDGAAIADAIAGVDTADVVEPDDTGEGEERDWQRIAERRQRRVEFLERKVENLEEYNDYVEDQGEADRGVQMEELKRRNRLIRELREEVELKSAAVERLEAERDRFREAVQRLDDGWVRVPRVDDLATADRSTVFVAEYSGEDVAPAVETVLTERPADALRDEGIAVIDIGEVERCVELPGAYVVHPDELTAAADSEQFMEWLENYRSR